MGYLDNQSNFDQNQAYLLTGETEPAGRPASPAPTTQQQQEAAQPAPPPRQESTSPESTQSRTLYDRLFSPIFTGVEEGDAALSEATDLFRADAGPSRTYESVGGAGAVQSAVETGDAPSVEAVKGYAGASYGGPQGLDSATMGGLQQLYQQMRARQGAFRGGGLQTLIREAAPGVTRGEARFESKRVLGDEAFRGQARTTAPLVRQFGSRLGVASQGAQDFAAQRTSEEDALREATRAALSGRKGDINASLAEQIAAAQQQQQGVQERYNAAVAPEGLAKDPEFAAMFGTDSQALLDEANKAFSGVIGDPRYASVAEFDPLQLMLTKRGSEGYQLAGDYKPGDWLDPTDAPGLTPQKVQTLRERQKALEAQFGRGEGAKYGEVRPLYDFGVGSYQGGQPTQYMGLDLGMKPSRENVSTADQRTQFNRITDMLGEIEKIAEAGDPYRAAQIFTDVDTYLADEEAYMESRSKELTKRERTWKNTVNKARKKYRKAKRNAKMAEVMALVSLSGIGIPSDIAAADWKWKGDDYSRAMKDNARAGALAQPGPFVGAR